LLATVHGEPLDPSRHPIDTEIKAVTYHQIAVEQTNGRWQTRVIFDL
jgi:SHS2 domain-containing protein